MTKENVIKKLDALQPEERADAVQAYRDATYHAAKMQQALNTLEGIVGIAFDGLQDMTIDAGFSVSTRKDTERFTFDELRDTLTDDSIEASVD